MLRRIFGPKRGEVTGEWRQLTGQERCVQVFGGELEGRRLLGRPRHRWEDNIKMGLQAVRWGNGLD